MSTTSSTREPIIQCLPTEMIHYIVYVLSTCLPLPPIGESAESTAMRDNPMLLQVASLLPATAAEALLAARFVAANAQAFESMRQSNDRAVSRHDAMRNISQAASMMRLADTALRRLLQLQTAREKADLPALAAAAEHHAATVAAPPPHVSVRPPPSVSATPPPPAAKPPAQPRPPLPPASLLDEAESYALFYPDRAALIRKAGGMPVIADFEAPDPALLRTLVSAQSAMLDGLAHAVA